MILDHLRAFREALTGDFVAAAEAERFARKMRDEHPRQWSTWCHAIAVQHVTVELARMERRQRRRALTSSRLIAANLVDVDALALFRVTFTVDEVNTRRPFGRMTAVDCRFAADSYRGTARQALMMAAFLDAVAKQIKTRTVEEVLTEDECRRLLVSLGGNGHELDEAA